jgi:hypothetical protein
MIITKELEINIERGNITYYRKIGYVLKVNTKLTIPIDILPKGSHTKIKASCDICHKEYDVPYRDYLKSHQIQNFDTCNKCKFQKTKLTNNEKYGSDTPLGNKDILEKYFKTNNERYGGNSSSCSQKILDKQRTTRIEKGMEIPTNKSVSDFKKYSNRVHNLSRKFKKELFNSWNGYDFYDREYIKDNFNLKYYHKNYPTIEHKISIFYGFMNNIDAKEIAKLENLAITKKSINSARRNKNFELFKNSFL